MTKQFVKSGRHARWESQYDGNGIGDGDTVGTTGGDDVEEARIADEPLEAAAAAAVAAAHAVAIVNIAEPPSDSLEAVVAAFAPAAILLDAELIEANTGGTPLENPELVQRTAPHRTGNHVSP